MEFVPNATINLNSDALTLNWGAVLEALAVLVVLAMLLERALAQFFDSHLFLAFELERSERGLGSFKPLIAFIVASAVCVLWQFDVVSILLGHQVDTLLGAIVTGAVVAGGSKGAIKLFEDVLGWRSRQAKALEEYQAGRGPKPTLATRNKKVEPTPQGG